LTKDKKDGLERDDAIFKPNFLDSALTDEPRGQWGIQKDSSENVAIIRNFLWPGYFSYHHGETKKFGGFYIGEGIKNCELPFML